MWYHSFALCHGTPERERRGGGGGGREGERERERERETQTLGDSSQVGSIA